MSSFLFYLIFCSVNVQQYKHITLQPKNPKCDRLSFTTTIVNLWNIWIVLILCFLVTCSNFSFNNLSFIIVISSTFMFYLYALILIMTKFLAPIKRNITTYASLEDSFLFFHSWCWSYSSRTRVVTTWSSCCHQAAALALLPSHSSFSLSTRDSGCCLPEHLSRIALWAELLTLKWAHIYEVS